MSCVVPGCPHRIGVQCENNISFHRFPADIELRKKWVKNVKKEEEWNPTQSSRICSAHFEKSFFREGNRKKTLHLNAVPTIFDNHPASCQLKLTKKRQLIELKHDIDSGTSTQTVTDWEEQIQLASPKKSRTESNYSSDEIDKSSSAEELKKMSKSLNKYKILAANRLRKLNTTRRQCSRLLKKIGDLEAIIELLHEKMDSEQVNILIVREPDKVLPSLMVERSSADPLECVTQEPDTRLVYKFPLAAREPVKAPPSLMMERSSPDPLA